MTMTKKLDGKNLTAVVEGRLDTLTAPALEAELLPALNGIEALVIDFKGLTYISSAGIRVLMQAAQSMEDQNGTFRIINANSDVKSIFTITGLTGALGVE